MQAGFTLYTYILLATSFIALITCRMAWRKRPSRGAVSLVILMISVSVWALFQALAFVAEDINVKLFLFNMRYFGIEVAPLCFYAVAYEYSYELHNFSIRKWLVYLGIPIIFMAALWTNPFHYKFYLSVTLKNNILILEDGPLFWLNMIYLYGFIISGVYLTIKAYINSISVYRKQSLIIALATLVPTLSNLTFNFNFLPFKNIDITPVSLLVTQLEKALLETKAAKEASEHANISRGYFLANMSHEIRTPMNAIIGITEILDTTDMPREEQRRYIKMISSSAESLLTILNDILDFSKIDAGKMEIEKRDLDLVKLLNEAVETFKILASNKSLELCLTIDKSLNNIFISDTVRIRQILTNLIGNAVKFTHEGRVEITAEQTKKENNMVFVSISNDYDLILMDVQMPEMDGLEVIRKIREKEKISRQHIPIIALTAGAMKKDVENCFEAGMDSHISKPIKVEKLFIALEPYSLKM